MVVVVSASERRPLMAMEVVLERPRALMSSSSSKMLPGEGEGGGGGREGRRGRREGGEGRRERRERGGEGGGREGEMLLVVSGWVCYGGGGGRVLSERTYDIRVSVDRCMCRV